MIDSILNDVLSWVANLITTIFDALSAGMLDTLKPQITTMVAYFPYLEAAEKAIVYIGYSLLFLIVVWQLFRTFGGPLTEAENPTHLIARSALFGLFIGFSADIFDILLRITLVPYNYLLNDVVIDQSSFSFASLGDSMNEGLAVNFTTQAGAAAIDLAAGSAVFVIIWIIMLVIVGWNYIKLLLEAVERYVMMGVLYFTSPLAFAAGGSKSTSQVFKSWCRMVASELLLLVMNVWFIRGFNAAIGKAIASGGILASGGGNMYLCMFMLVGFLHIGQNMDKYLATIGMNTAQTGQGLMGDVLIASRFAMGAAHVASARSVFGNGSHGSHGKASDPGSYKPSIANNLSFERAKADAMRDGGIERGGGGPLALAQKAAARVAVNNGATVSAKALSDVVNMSSRESGIMRGESLDKSLGNFMPGLKNYDISGTELESGHIRTTATNAEGKSAEVEMFSTGAYDAPDGPYSIVSDADGRQWYQIASGEAAGDFYDGSHFEGSPSEAGAIADEFPDNPEISSLRDVEPGVREAMDAEGNRSMMYNSAYFDEPDAPHETMTSKDGVDWYSVPQAEDIPAFDANGIAQTEIADDVTPASGETAGVFSDSDVTETAAGGEFGGSSFIQNDAPVDAEITDTSASVSSADIPYNDPVPEAVSDITSDEAAGLAIAGGTAGAEMDISDRADVIPVGRTADTEAAESKASDTVYADTTSAGGHSYTSDNTDITDAHAGNTAYSSGESVTPSSNNKPMDTSSYDKTAENTGTTPYNQTAANTGYVPHYARTSFQEFMPGYEGKVSSVDSSMRSEGQLEVTHADGTATRFYDSAVYAPPKGNYKVYEDAQQHQWIAIQGKPVVETRPVFFKGKPEYDANGELITEKVSAIRYPNEPQRFATPERRNPNKIGNTSEKRPRRKR